MATLSLGFTACEDVPAPYEVNGDGSNTGSSVILDEKFSTSLGDFSPINTEGDYSWNCSFSCAQVTSFVDTDGNGGGENNGNDDGGGMTVIMEDTIRFLYLFLVLYYS